MTCTQTNMIFEIDITVKSKFQIPETFKLEDEKVT